MKKIYFLITIVLAACLFNGCTNPHTPAGHEGYVYEEPRIWGKGGQRGTITGPGNYGISLWNNKIINIDIRPETYNETFKILAKDDLNISFNIHAMIKIVPGNTTEIIQDYDGVSWYKRFIKEPYRTFVRESVQIYSSKDIKGNRENIALNINKKLGNHLKDSPFKLIKMVVGNIDYPAIVAKAVENKLAKKQLLEEKETQKRIAQKDAEIKIEEAKGIARAQEIINKTLTQNYLQHEAIQAQVKMAASPNHTTVYIPVGSNGIPVMHNIK